MIFIIFVCVQLKSKSMEQISTQIETGYYTLIDGSFNTEDGSEIVNELIHKKISFHRLRAFSDRLKFGIEDHWSKRRISALQRTQREFNDLVNKAKLSGKSLRIISTVHVEIAD